MRGIMTAWMIKVMCFVFVVTGFPNYLEAAEWERLNGPFKEADKVLSVAVHPNESNTIYVGLRRAPNGKDGGVWKSTNGGLDWRRTLDLYNHVSCIAIDSNNPDNIYIGSLFIGRIFKSTDGGESWRQSADQYLLHQGIEALAIDPNNSERIFAATTEEGVFRSKDGGEYWYNIGLPDTPTKDVKINPSNSNVYVATSHDSGAVFKSTNGGDSWFCASAGLPSGHKGLCLEINPFSPETMFVGLDSSGIYRTENGGESWELCGLANSSVSYIRIDPEDRIYAGTVSNGLFASEDGGDSWIELDIRFQEKDIQAIEIDPVDCNVIWVGTLNGGLLKSVDKGKTSTPVIIQSPSLPVFDISFTRPESSSIYCATGGPVCKSSDGGYSWKSLNADGDRVAVCPEDSDLILVARMGWDGVHQLWGTVDGGEHWDWIDSWGFGSFNQIKFHPTNCDTAYILWYGGLVESADGGLTWEGKRITFNENGFLDPWCLNFDPENSDIVYSGGRSAICKSIDGGETWNLSSYGLPYSVPPTLDTLAYPLAIDPNDPNTLYVVCAGKLFKSTDGASSWFAIGDSLINSQLITELVVSPVNSQFIYAGTADSYYYGETGNGVYKSEDGGCHWVEMNEGLTNLRINRLEVDPSHPDILYACTNAGLFRYDTQLTAVDEEGEDKPPLPGEFEMAQNYPNPFNPETAIVFSLKHTEPVTLSVFNLLGEKVATVVDGIKLAGEHRIHWNGCDDGGNLLPSGLYFYRLQTPSQTLTRKMTLIR